MNKSRRNLVLALSAGLVTGPATVAHALMPTPRQTPGPFYPPQLPLDDDNDLTRVQGQSGSSDGVITDLDGQVLDINGLPIPNARIEIWQCDANGRYRHPAEHSKRKIDDRFQGHGHAISTTDGAYRFRTIRPCTA